MLRAPHQARGGPRGASAGHTAPWRIAGGRSSSGSGGGRSRAALQARAQQLQPQPAVTQQQHQEKYRLTISGPPSTEEPETRLVDNPLTAPGEVLSLRPSKREPPPATINVGRAQAREQAALLQARNEEIRALREALVAEQSQRHEIQARYTELLAQKDRQLEALYQIAADASSERGALRAEYVNLANELRATQQQVHAYTQSLIAFTRNLEGAGEGDEAAAAAGEVLIAAGMGAAAGGGEEAPLEDGELAGLLTQLHELSRVLVEDMRRDQEALAAGLASIGAQDEADRLLEGLQALGVPTSIAGGEGALGEVDDASAAAAAAALNGNGHSNGNGAAAGVTGMAGSASGSGVSNGAGGVLGGLFRM